MSNNRLFKLKHLVEELTDRDQKIKEDLLFFESIFESFPVPVAFWSVDLAGKLFSKKLSSGTGWDVIDKDADCLSKFYKCPLLQDDMDKHWEKVADGEPSSFMSVSTGGPSGDIYVWNRLIPTMADEKVVGVTGLCWDVSTNYIMLESLKKIAKSAKGKPELKEIYDNAVIGIERSRLNKLINAGGN